MRGWPMAAPVCLFLRQEGKGMIYQIAELWVEMNTFGRTLRQAIPYMSEQKGNIDIKVFPDLNIVKKYINRLSEEEVEYMATGQNFRKQLLNFDGMVLHASAVVKDGKAYLFTAHSGTGKSTHTKLWQNVYGEDKVFILNDDKPALRKINDIWYAYGTPWSGKHDLNRNEKVPVGGICILERGEKNKIEPCSKIVALQKLLSFSGRTQNAELLNSVLDVLEEILTDIPIWRMECNMDPEAAILSYETMSGIRKEELK